jgi:purine-nucleoside phosphorylase
MIAPNILIVGDPERVPIIAKKYLKEIEHDVSHRGLRTMTGMSIVCSICKHC